MLHALAHLVHLIQLLLQVAALLLELNDFNLLLADLLIFALNHSSHALNFGLESPFISVGVL